MKRVQYGIIGGTGLGDYLMKEAGGEPVDVDTPFGRPSCPPIVAKWEDREVAFIARHGAGHRFNPSTVPYRANIWALKLLGVERVIASGATGSLREDIEPGHLVLCDQVIDKTYRRANTFFDEGIAVHVELAEPFCPALRQQIALAEAHLDVTVHHAGTYVCMEGPQFSTRAESQMHRQWGGDVIGMTCMPEARLAREAELCYAMIALPTDYDCWRPADPDRPHDALLGEILENLHRATDAAVRLIRETLRRAEESSAPCGCRNALRLAVWSERSRLDPALKRRLRPLLGRYLDDNDG